MLSEPGTLTAQATELAVEVEDPDAVEVADPVAEPPSVEVSDPVFDTVPLTSPVPTLPAAFKALEHSLAVLDWPVSVADPSKEHARAALLWSL